MRLLLLLALLAPACATAQRDAQLTQRLDAIAARQEQLGQQQAALLAQYDALEREQLVVSARQQELAAELGRISPIVSGIEDRTKPAAKPPRPGQPDPTATFKVDLGLAHARGPATAKVTIVAWGDYQCPFTGRVQPTLAELRKIYGDDLRVVAKHNPLPMHKQALPAALAAEAAGKQGKFWEMHDRLFQHQKELEHDDLVAHAKKLRLDVRKFKRALDDPELRAKIDADQQQGSQLGARGTPAFFINGRFLSGAQPVESFRTVIDEEMREADAKLQQGVPRERLYETIVADGRTAL